MTDLEKIELALRKVSARAVSSPIGYWFAELADQIAADEIERGSTVGDAVAALLSRK